MIYFITLEITIKLTKLISYISTIHRKEHRISMRSENCNVNWKRVLCDKYSRRRVCLG